MKLLYDLYTIYGVLLGEKNEEITPSMISRIRRLGENHKQVKVRMQNTAIMPDFVNVFDDPRYAIIFKEPIPKDTICRVAGELMLENDIIFELTNMKQNLPYTYRHLLIVAALSIKLALSYKPGTFNKSIIAHCGFTHDIGKTRIPIEILNKQGALDHNERAIIETHPMLGYLLLNYYLKKDRRECAIANLGHHERLDGSGYPKGTKRMDKYTRLICAIDVFDALLTKRVYRTKVYTARSVLNYLMQETDKGRLDKDVVMRLIQFARKDKPDLKTMVISREERDDMPEDVVHEKYA